MGSSSYISNLDGEVVQHIEYVPFGEVFLEEKNAKWNTPYLFNAKELDKESGMYYYGARYYDPKTSVWISVDPLAVYNPVMESQFYYDGDHNGGMYNSGNLNTYGYCYQNPILYVDPNGKQVEWGKYWDQTERFLNDAGDVVNKVGENLAPIRPMKQEEVARFESKYGKSDGNPLHDIQRSANALSDVPGDILESLKSLSWEGFKDKFKNASAKEKTEMALTAGIILLSLKKGKIDTKDIAMMGNAGKNFKILTANLLKKAGIDAHELKYEFLGKKAKISEYDLYKHTDTNEVLILKKGGKGDPIHTGEFIND